MMYNLNIETSAFVGDLIMNESDPQPWTVEDAAYNMECWAEEDIEMPEGMTPEMLTAEWNEQFA